jgi:Protein of unknown function (DUF2934)
MSSGTATGRTSLSGLTGAKKNPENPATLHARISRRAYELYEEHGRQPGHELEDWLQAEQDILSERMDTDFG